MSPQNIGTHPDFLNSEVVYDDSTGLYRTDPYPSEVELAEFYSKEYRQIRQESPNENYIAFMEHRAHAQRDFILKHADRESLGRVMDIGCGCGTLLNALAPHADALSGFETDSMMANHARDHRVDERIAIHNAHFVADQTAELFDLVAMSHVLEHVPEPAIFLKKLLEGPLSESGLLFVEVPNDPSHWLKIQIDEKYRGLGHVNYFTPKSLQQVIEAAGMEVISSRLCGKSLHSHIRSVTGGSLVRRVRGVLRRVFPKRAALPDYSSSPPNDEGIYLQTLAIFRKS